MKASGGLLLLVVFVLGCAADVHVPYPYPRTQAETGQVLIKFTEPMRQVNVQIDGALVAEDEHTARVEIQDVPAGAREIEVAASEGHRSEAVHLRRTVHVQPGREATVLIGTPPASTGYWAYLSLYGVAALAIFYLR